MNIETIKKKKEKKYILLRGAEKKKPFMGAFVSEEFKHEYFKNRREFDSLLKNSKPRFIHLLETDNPSYNEKMTEEVNITIKKVTGKYPFIILNSFNYKDYTLKEYYDSEYNTDKLSGLTEEEIEFDKEYSKKKIIERMAKMGIQVKEKNEKGFIEGGFSIPLKIGEVKTTVIKFY